jgi:hypothetical protein
MTNIPIEQSAGPKFAQMMTLLLMHMVTHAPVGMIVTLQVVVNMIQVISYPLLCAVHAEVEISKVK